MADDETKFMRAKKLSDDLRAKCLEFVNSEIALGFDDFTGSQGVLFALMEVYFGVAKAIAPNRESIELLMDMQLRAFWPVENAEPVKS